MRTSGNELLRLELGWFKNADGYALKRDEAYCYQVDQLQDGTLMLISLQSCAEGSSRDQDKEDHERDQTPPA